MLRYWHHLPTNAAFTRNVFFLWRIFINFDGRTINQSFMSVNKVILVGNVGRDPAVRYVEGRAVAELSLATTERAYTTASGARIEERTEWHRLVMWDSAAETAEKYITKGTKLFVEGKLRTRSWTDRAGLSHKLTEVLVENFDILARPTSNS